MKTIEQAVTDAAAIYMPKGKEVALCTEFLEGMGFEPPQLNDDAPEGIDSSGRLYSRVRAKDGVKLLASGNGPDNAVAFAGTDVCEELIAADPGTNLEYAEFGTDSTCTYDLLLPKNAPESVVKRLLGEGEPLTVVTSLPRMLARCALERGLNIVPSEYVPEGGVEIIAKRMIEQGQADAAADLVTFGRSSEKAGFWSSRSEDLPTDYPVDPVLRAIYGAVVWRKPGAESKPKVDLGTGIDRMDAALLNRYGGETNA